MTMQSSTGSFENEGGNRLRQVTPIINSEIEHYNRYQDLPIPGRRDVIYTVGMPGSNQTQVYLWRNGDYAQHTGGLLSDDEVVVSLARERRRRQDAGSDARERLTARTAARKAKRFLIWTISLAIVLVLMAIGAYVYYVATHIKKGYVQDQRSCTATVGKQTITGTRTYSYPYQDYSFPWLGDSRFIDKSQVSETTKIDIRGDAITVTGFMADRSWWTIPVTMGERGVQVLKPAQTYVFVMNNGKDVQPVDALSFCK